MGTDDQPKAYHRVLAGEIRPGMRVTRHRNHPTRLVVRVQLSADTIWLIFDDHTRARPRHDAQWWMEHPADVT